MLVRNSLPYLLTCLLLTISTQSRGQAVIDSQSLYKNLKNNLFETTKVAEVRNVVLAKSGGQLFLKEGKLYLSENEGGGYILAFEGRGNLSVQVPDEIERSQVRRFLQSDSIAQEFTSAFFCFSDSTYFDLQSKLNFELATKPPKLSDLPGSLNKILTEDYGLNIYGRIVADVTNNLVGEQGFFLAVLEQPQVNFNFPGYSILMIDPQARENVGFFQFFPHRAPRELHTVCSFSTGNDRIEVFEIQHYDLDVTLRRNPRIFVVAEISFVARVSDLSTLSFDIFDDIEIQSVRSSRGDSLLYLKEKKEPGVTIFLNQKVALNTPDSITIEYSGNLLEPVGFHYLLKDNFNWIPRAGYLKATTYDVEYRFPDNMQLISVGEKIDERQQDNERIATWQMSQPTFAMAFGFGFFDSNDYKIGDLPVAVYSREDRRSGFRNEVAKDVAGSVFFLQSLLGESPYQDLKIVETPNLVSNSFPAFIFLTSLSYGHVGNSQIAAIRAHEVSHQWWGNLVGWQTYRDQWLSEGLAEYTGAMLTHFVTGNEASLYHALQGWRSDLLDKGHVGVGLGLRRFGFSASDLARSDGLQAGPVCLGQRLGSKYPVDYFVNVYEKGAYVMHMLRTMLRDFETGDDSRFLALLQDYAASFAGKRPTTADFEKIVGQHFGEDMSWFFQQWIYGTDVPTYDYSYEFQERSGEHFVILEIEQHGAPPQFRAAIPITIVFEQEAQEMRLIRMSGVKKAFEFGPFLKVPRKFIFNDFFGVLAYTERK